MAMRCNQRMRDSDAADLAHGGRARQKSWIEFTNPAGERFACTGAVPGCQRNLNLAERLTEATETDGSVENGHVKGQLNRGMQTAQAPMHQTHERDRQSNDQHPTHHPVLSGAGIGMLAHPIGRRREFPIDPMARAQRAGLLDQ